MRIELHDVLQERVFSERTTQLQEANNRFTFCVHPDANKIQIREAVEKIFKIKVVKVNTMWVRGKRRQYQRVSGRTAHWKKAIVTVAEGQQIQLS